MIKKYLTANHYEFTHNRWINRLHEKNCLFAISQVFINIFPDQRTFLHKPLVSCLKHKYLATQL